MRMRWGTLAIALALAGCMVGSPTAADEQPSTCPSYGPATYSPYAARAKYPSDSVANLPWRGPANAYPDGDESFSNYGTAMPVMIECSDDKRAVPYLDVTDGCLGAVAIDGGKYIRGEVHATPDNYFRTVALGYAAGEPDHAVKWTDQAVEYRFYYTAQVGTNGNPGFKAFARYRTEDDLYVGSWRMDGVAQIQRKQCGAYTELLIDPSFGAPAPNMWHTIRFAAAGDELQLTLDGKLAVDTTDSAFSSGTAGIRIDAMDGAYLDDWKVE
jgi:hypothetical protein